MLSFQDLNESRREAAERMRWRIDERLKELREALPFDVDAYADHLPHRKEGYEPETVTVEVDRRVLLGVLEMSLESTRAVLPAMLQTVEGNDEGQMRLLAEVVDQATQIHNLRIALLEAEEAD